jgi:hypothetical protein
MISKITKEKPQCGTIFFFGSFAVQVLQMDSWSFFCAMTLKLHSVTKLPKNQGRCGE